MSNQATVPWSRRSVFWGHICGLACIFRALSYWILPPAPNSLSSKTFEQLLPYSEWAWILFSLGTAAIVCTAFQFARLSFTVHLLIVFCYLVFAYSSIGGIFEYIIDGSTRPIPPFWVKLLDTPEWLMYLGIREGTLYLEQSWAGIFPLIIVGLLNGERVLNLGAIIRHESAARQEASQQSRDES